MLEGHEHCAICMLEKINDWPYPPRSHEVVRMFTPSDLDDLIVKLKAEKFKFPFEPCIIIDSYPHGMDYSLKGQRLLFEGMRDQLPPLNPIFPLRRHADYGEDPVASLESQEEERKRKLPPSSLLASLLKRFRVKEGYEKPDSEKPWGPMFVNPNNADDCARG